jgi:sulfate permease, SulP family
MSWAGEVKGSLNGAASSFAIAAATGTLVFASLGVEGIALGIVASLIGSVVGGLVATLLSSTPIAMSAPRAAVSLVVAGLVAALHRLLPEASAATIVTLTCCTVMVAGLLQLAGSLARLGRLVRFVPFPVIAGFTHGIALTLILAYTPMLAGVADVPRLRWPDLAAIHWAAPFLGVVTLASAFGFSRAGPKWPALFLALVVGVVAHLVLTAVSPAIDAGPVFDPRSMTTAIVPLRAALDVRDLAKDPAIWRLLLSFAVAIAAVASIDSLMGALAIETRFAIRSRPDRDLAAQGMANIVSGAAGGLAIAYSVVSVQAAYAAGARSRASGPLSALVVALLAIAGASLLESLSLVVLAALMVFVATRLADPWGFALLRSVSRPGGLSNPLVRESFIVYVLVAFSMVALDILSALMVGLVASAALFVRTLNRQLVRGVTSGHAIRSRRLHPPAVMQMLHERMHGVAVIELEGPLFFGTADRIVEEIEGLSSEVRYVVVDLRRVQALDATAAAVLTRVSARFGQQQRSFVICGGPAGLVAVGDELPPAFRDRDRALEWIEQRLITESLGEIPEARLEPRAFGEAMGLNEEETQALLPHLESRALSAGEMVFGDGDPSDELYFLLSGRVSIVHGEAGPDALRVVTFLPGNVFGNIAFADALPRTASAVCDADCTLVLLRRAALRQIGSQRPDLVMRIYIELAADLASRLRATDSLVRESA